MRHLSDKDFHAVVDSAESIKGRIKCHRDGHACCMTVECLAHERALARAVQPGVYRAHTLAWDTDSRLDSPVEIAVIGVAENTEVCGFFVIVLHDGVYRSVPLMRFVMPMPDHGMRFTLMHPTTVAEVLTDYEPRRRLARPGYWLHHKELNPVGVLGNVTPSQGCDLALLVPLRGPRKGLLQLRPHTVAPGEQGSGFFDPLPGGARRFNCTKILQPSDVWREANLLN